MNISLIFLSCCLLASCGTTNIYPRQPTMHLQQPFPGGRVFVTNQKMSEELVILKASGIYEISENTKEHIHLTLERRKERFTCGWSHPLTILTLGLFPATIPC